MILQNRLQIKRIKMVCKVQRKTFPLHPMLICVSEYSKEITASKYLPLEVEYVVVVVVCLASGWEWLSIVTPCLCCKARKVPPTYSLP